MIGPEKFTIEFILHAYNTTIEQIKSSLAEFGDCLEVVDCKNSQEKGCNFKINISTEDPTLIFDVCSQFGRIRSVKVN